MKLIHIMKLQILFYTVTKPEKSSIKINLNRFMTFFTEIQITVPASR